MIETKNLVPEVYYNRSRDFQVLGRIYDIILNYVKTNTQVINNAPYSEDIDDVLIPLISTTLGFKQTHEYNTNQLKVLCSSFVSILRNKGNFTAIETLLSILGNVENTKDSYDYAIDKNNPYLLNIYLPLSISDTSLFEDMLYYVLPAGMSYRIIKELIIEETDTKTTMFISSDRSNLKIERNYNIISSQITQPNMNPHMENSTDVGIGRLEDMHIIQHQPDTEQLRAEESDERDADKIYPSENNGN